MRTYTYLLIDVTTVIFCFLFSFDKRIKFYPYFMTVFKGIFMVAIPFIAWDVWFTAKGVWWFHSQYTMGVDLLGLPIEEWLFFVCIPFSCVFTFYCLERFLDLVNVENWQTPLVWSFLFILSISVALFCRKLYPLVTGIVTMGTLVYLHFIRKVRWLARASLVYLLLLPGFFIVNGVLTGTGLLSPVVNYNPKEIINFRILTIPIEDFVYGYSLILLNIHFFILFRRRLAYRS